MIFDLIEKFFAQYLIFHVTDFLRRREAINIQDLAKKLGKNCLFNNPKSRLF